MPRRLLVVGATGDVGQGIVAAALQAGWQTVAAARNEERLARLRAAHQASDLEIVAGDLRSADAANALWSAVNRFGTPDAVVVAVNAPNTSRPMLDWSPADLLGVFEANVATHFIAAQSFIPRLPAEGIFVGIGGGTADFVIPKMGQLSMAQAALRMMYRAIARERRGVGPAIRELLIVAQVNGEKRRAVAESSWITDIEVGRHVCAILADPARFSSPILTLQSREQVGKPAAETAA